MPGEEANVYLGLPQPGRHAGHWLYLFPSPVYWTLISGDGVRVHRQRIDLSDTGRFGGRELRLEVDLTGKNWGRLEAWAIARNGAFTQPVWRKPADSGNAGPN